MCPRSSRHLPPPASCSTPPAYTHGGIFVEGAGNTPTRPRRHHTKPPIRRRVPEVPQRAHLVPRPAAGHSGALRLGRPAPAPPPLQDQGCPPQSAGPLARTPGCPPAPRRRHDPRGPREGPWGQHHPALRARARARPPLPALEARDGPHTFLRTKHVTAVTGVHLVCLPPATPEDPRGPRALSPTEDWELWRGELDEWLARLPPECRLMAAAH